MPHTTVKSSFILLLSLTISAPALNAATVGAAEDLSSSGNWRGVWSGSNSYVVNDVVSYSGNTYINILATSPVASAPAPFSGANLFDMSAVTSNAVIVSGTGEVAGIGGFTSTGYVNTAGASSFVTNITLGVFPPYGVAFYDNNKTWVAGTTLNDSGYYPAGVPISIPVGASYARFWWQDGHMGTTIDQAIIDIGTTLQSQYTPYGGSTSTAAPTITPSATPTDATHWTVVTSSANTGPWAGKKMFMLGDSIVWQNPAVAGLIAARIGAQVSSTGATGPGVDAFPGRFFSNFQNGQGSGGYLPLSPQVLQDVDLMLIALGTNQDSNQGLGTANDLPNQYGSMSAEMRYMLETIMSWKPGMRVVVIGPYQSNRYNVPAGIGGIQGLWPGSGTANQSSIGVISQINAQMKQICNLYSIPYLDMFDESGLNFTTSSLWLADGLHPNTLGYSTFYVPYIAAQLSRYVQQ